MHQNKRTFLRGTYACMLSFMLLWSTIISVLPAAAAEAEPMKQNAATSARLLDLDVSIGNLNPVFSPDTTEYTAAVPVAYDQVTVTPVVEENGANVTVSINGESPTTVTSGTYSSSLKLEIGNNIISVKVTSSDSVVSRTYRITVPKTSVVLQQGINGYTGTQDAHVSEGIHGVKNTGMNNAFEVGYYDASMTDRKLGLLRFDLASIPSQAIISEANLGLYLTGTRVRNGNPLNNKNIYLHELTSDWVEGTGTGFDGTVNAPGVVWNTRPSYNDTVTSVTYNNKVNVGTASNVWYSWPVTDLVKSWMNGSLPNYGVVMKEADTTSNASTLTSTKDFASAQYPVAPAPSEAVTPKLSLIYKLPLQGVKLDSTQVALNMGDAPIRVNAFARPLNAVDTNVLWSSSNTAVATVDASGKIAAVGVGTAIVKAAVGGFEASLNVTVTAAFNKGTLANLSLNGAKLDSVFSSNQLSYTAKVPLNARHISIVPTASELNAKITVRSGDGQPQTVNSGSKSLPFALVAGRATLIVRVESVETLAPGEVGVHEYTIQVAPRVLGGEADKIISKFLDPNGDVMVIAHRGNWLNGKPENGLDSIRESISEGLDMVELDIRNTRDGVPVLMHDDTINRTTNGSGSVSSFTLAEIKNFCLKTPSGAVSNPCEKIPTLEEAMQVARGHIMINLDNKNAFNLENLNSMWDILVRTDTTDHALFKANGSYKSVITSFMTQFKDSAAEPLYMLLATDQASVYDYLNPQTALFPTLAVELSFSNDDDPVMDPAFINNMHNLGARAWVNTIYSVPGLVGRHGDYAFLTDPTAGYPWLLGRGVDMFQTDTTSLLLKYLKDRLGEADPGVTQTVVLQDGLNGYKGTADTHVAELTANNNHLHNFGGNSQIKMGPINPLINWMTGQVTQKVSAITAIGSSPANEVIGNLLDASITTKWLAFQNTSIITMSMQQPTKVQGYAISSAEDAPGRDPRNWTFEGSMDGLDWVILDTKANEVFINRNQTKFYKDFNNQTAYAHYRLNITANSGEPYVQIAELQLSDGGLQVKDDQPGDRGYGLLQFDLAPVPQGAKVESAKLEMYMVGAGNVTDPLIARDVKLHKVTAAWAEGSGTGTTGTAVPDGQNWVSWTTKPPVSDSIASRQTIGTELYSWQSFDMTKLVSDWLADSSKNFGVMLDPGAISYAFSSSENGVQNWRPKLTVTYSIPVTAIDVAPKLKTIKIGEQTKLTASLQPANATNHNVTWKSADTTIAAVSADGIVTGVRTGITTITAKSLDGGFEATSEISVESSGINANLSGLSLSSGSFTEAFVSSLEHYTAIVPEANNQVQVTALTEDNLSTVTVSLNHGEAKPVLNGQPSDALQLEIGNNLITVQVTSPGAKVQRTYTIEVAKAAIVLQEGVGGYVGTTDTQISKGTGGQGNKYYQYNFGAQHGIEVGYYNQNVMDEKYGLIRFDHLPIPEGATITSATLNLYHFGSRGSNGTIANTDKEIFVHQASAPWVEGRGGNSSSNDGAPGEPGEVTWENYITNLSNSYDPAVIDSKIVTQSPKWNTFDITGVVRNWTANPDLNYGVLLKRETFADASNSNIIGTKQFRTSEYSTVEQRPYLRIVYEMALKGIELDRSELSLSLGGGAKQLKANLIPFNAVDQRIVWSSLDQAIASVDSQGNVTPVSEGSTIITATNGIGVQAQATVTVRKPGTQAGLTGLALSAGKLDPVFATDTLVYTAAVPLSAASFTLTPTAEDANSLITVRAGSDVPQTVVSGTPTMPIAINDQNEIMIQVTSEDGQITREYKIVIAQQFGLSNLAVSAGSLSPAFTNNVLQYAVEVPASTTGISLKPVVLDPSSTVHVITGAGESQLVESGADSQLIALKPGMNVVWVQVESLNGSVSKTYYVVIYRKSADNPASGGSGGSGGGGGGGGQASNGPALPDPVKLDDELSVQLPVEEAGLKLTLRKSNESVSVGNYPALSPVFEILKDKAGTIAKPLILTFAFKASSTGAGRPSVFRYNENQGKWLELGGDVKGETISVAVTEVGKFAVLLIQPQSGSGSVPEQETGSHTSWPDVKSHWAKQTFITAYEKGIINGYADGNMRPDELITRVQFATMLVRALDLKSPSTGITFTDKLDIPDWAASQMASAVEAGILTGYEDGSLRPNVLINRAEMITMLMRAFHVNAGNQKDGSFKDTGSIPDWAQSFIAKAAELGIISGYEDGTFKPMNGATRAEALTALLRLIEVK